MTDLGIATSPGFRYLLKELYYDELIMSFNCFLGESATLELIFSSALAFRFSNDTSVYLWKNGVSYSSYYEGALKRWPGMFSWVRVKQQPSSVEPRPSLILDS